VRPVLQRCGWAPEHVSSFTLQAGIEHIPPEQSWLVAQAMPKSSYAVCPALHSCG
jgi:hypothetical protein